MSAMEIFVYTLAGMTGVVIVGGLLAMQLSHKRKSRQHLRSH